MAGRRDFLKRFGIGIVAAPVAVQVAEAALAAPAKVAPAPEPPKVYDKPPVPQVVNGRYFDAAFSYVHNSVLAAEQTTLGNLISIFSEADFLLRGLVITSTGPFAYRLQDGHGYYLSSGFVRSNDIIAKSGDPFPFVPEVIYPAGGRLWIDLQNLSGRVNEIQMIFVGANRFMLDMPSNGAITTSMSTSFYLPDTRLLPNPINRRLRS